MVDRPTIENLSHWLDESLAHALGDRSWKTEISLMSSEDALADSTTKLLVRDSAGRSRAFVLCSAPASPDMVQRAMIRAHLAKVTLGPALGAKILDPLFEGRVQGLSYAVLPYCNSLSDFAPHWLIQRAMLLPSIFDWLWRVVDHTVRDVEPGAISRCFAAPLRHITSMESLDDHLRTAAERAAKRLDSGAWTPRRVLMHGDLWKGNLLVGTANADADRKRWRDRIVVIDWAGSETRSYAIYDLIRLAESMHLSRRRLQFEIERHCRVLQCDPTDAMSHLLAALGHVAMRLEHFPIDRYARMAKSCITILDGIAT